MINFAELSIEELENLTDKLWDALRLEACATKLNAHRIVMIHKSDIKNALNRIKNNNLEK